MLLRRFSYWQIALLVLCVLALEYTLYRNFYEIIFLKPCSDSIESAIGEADNWLILFFRYFVKYNLFGGIIWILFHGRKLFSDLNTFQRFHQPLLKKFLLFGTHIVSLIVMAFLNSNPNAYCFFGASHTPRSFLSAYVISGLVYSISTFLIVAPKSFWFGYFRKNLKIVILWVIFIGIFAYLSAIQAFNVVLLEDYFHTLLFPPTSWMVVSILNLIGFATTTNLAENQITLDAFSVEVQPACLGYEGVIISLIVLSFYFFFNRQRLNFPHILLIYPLIISILFFLNSLRIVVLMMIGVKISSDMAILGFHSAAGWVELLIVLGLSLLLVNKSAFFSKVSTDFTFDFSKNKIQLVPQVLLMFASLFSLLLSPGFEWVYPFKVIIVGILLWSWWPNLNLKFSRQLFLPITVGVITFLIWIGLVPVDSTKSDFFATKLFSVPQWGVLLWISFRILGAGVIVPLAEELAFRGYLFDELVDFLETYLGKYRVSIKVITVLLATSVGFGILHSDWLAATLSGFLFGLIRLYRNRVMDAVIAHSVTNLLLSAYVLHYSAWSLW